MYRTRCAVSWLLLLAAALPLFAQTVFPQSQTPPTSVPAPAATQSPAAYTALDADIDRFEFAELRNGIAALPPSLARDYYAGMLANRAGQPADSAGLLERSLPWARQSDPKRVAWALEALADDYVKTFRYADAVRAYQDLFQNYSGQLEQAQKKDDDDDYQALKLMRDAPPQTIQLDGPIALPTHRNAALDTIDADLTVNGVTESWIIDTGANFTTVSESFARRLGIRLSENKAQTQGITGAENELRVAILPELRLGGAVVRNVVLLVLKDDNLNVPAGPKKHYQIQAVLGYPVLQALGRFTLTRDHQFLAGPASPGSESGAPLYMYKLSPLMECRLGSRPLLFAFDSGADKSVFTDRYFRDFPNQFHGLHKRRYGMGGAGGVRKMKVFYLPEARLDVGGVTATLRNVPVLPRFATNLNKFYGNLGRDLTDAYDYFTVDLANMRLSLGTPIGAKAK